MLPARAKRIRRPTAKVLEALEASGLGMEWRDSGAMAGEGESDSKQAGGVKGDCEVGTMEIDDRRTDEREKTEGTGNGKNESKNDKTESDDKTRVGDEDTTGTETLITTQNDHNDAQPENKMEKTENGNGAESTATATPSERSSCTRPQTKIRMKIAAKNKWRRATVHEITTLSTCPPALVEYMRTLDEWDPESLDEWVQRTNEEEGTQYELGYRGRGALKRCFKAMQERRAIRAQCGYTRVSITKADAIVAKTVATPGAAEERGAKRSYDEMEAGDRPGTEVDVAKVEKEPGTKGEVGEAKVQVKAGSDDGDKVKDADAKTAASTSTECKTASISTECKPSSSDTPATTEPDAPYHSWTARLELAHSQINDFAPFDRAHAFNLYQAHSELQERITKLESAVDLALQVRENVTTFARIPRRRYTGSKLFLSPPTSPHASDAGPGFESLLLEDITKLKEFLPHHASDLAAEHGAIEREMAALERDIRSGERYREAVYRRSGTVL